MNRVLELRKERNLTLKEMAKILNVSVGSYNYYELGKTEPDIGKLKQLADFFCVSIDYLVGNEETEQATRFEVKTVLDEKEKELIRVYRSLSDGGKNTLIGSAHNIERFDPQVSAAKKA